MVLYKCVYMPVAAAVLDEIAPRARDCARPLRVLQVISSVADVHGGATTAMWSTLEALRLRNIQSDLATTDEDGPKRRMKVPLGKFTRHHGHNVCFFPYALDRYTTSWPMARWLLAHVTDYDVIHVHGLFRFAPVAAAHAALIRRVPYVITPHNTLGHWGMQNRRPLLKRLSIGMVEGRMVDNARRVHLCSEDELAQATQVRQLGERSAVFPLGLDLSADLAEEPDATAERPMTQKFAGRKVVLFMSRIHEIKGVDKLLAAFVGVLRAHPEAMLVIAGPGQESLVTSLHHQARQLGIQDRTHWLGMVKGSLKQELLSMASVFVLPSLSENFGYVIVEAMLAGLPVITTLNVPAGRFVTEARAGIVCDGTVETLQQSIVEVLGMPAAYRRELAMRASATVRDRLSLANFGESLERLYEEACQPSS